MDIQIPRGLSAELTVHAIKKSGLEDHPQLQRGKIQMSLNQTETEITVSVFWPEQTVSHAQVVIERLQALAGGGFGSEIKIDQKNYELHNPHVITKTQLKSLLPALALARLTTTDLTSLLTKLRMLRLPPYELQPEPNPWQVMMFYRPGLVTPATALSDLEVFNYTNAHRHIVILHHLTSSTLPEASELCACLKEKAHIVILIGPEKENLRQHLARGSGDTHVFETGAEAFQWITPFLRPTDALLISGSRYLKP